MSWTFYLQDSDSGLFLTNPGDTSNVSLEKHSFSINQTWYWGESGNRLICGTGKVMGAEYGTMIDMSSWPYPSDKQIFKIEKDDSFITISHQGKYLANHGGNQIGLDEENPIAWRQTPTNQGYHWKGVGKREDFPDEAILGCGEGGSAKYAFGQGHRGDTLHMGMAKKIGSVYEGQKIDRYLGCHDESLMSEMPFYLQHVESGEYLTCPTEQYDDIIKLAPLECSPGQMWKWTAKQEDGRSILSSATFSLVNCSQCPEGPAMKTSSYSTPPDSSMLFKTINKRGVMFIVNDEENGKVLGIKEMYGKKMATLGKAGEDEGLSYEWKVVPVEQGFRWVAADSASLPDNAVSAGLAEDGSDVYVGRGQVNGRLHFGTVNNGKRTIGYHCRSRFGKYQHCNHCCNREKCQDSDYNNEDNIKEVETEEFSVLCAEEGAEWVEYSHGTPPSAYAVDWSAFPKHAAVAGINNHSHVVYVGRKAIDGHAVTGFFSPSYENTKLTVFHQGKIQEVEGFEALVINKEITEVDTEVYGNDPDAPYFGVDNVAESVTNEKFSVLCIDAGAQQEWVDYEKDKLPDGAVIAGVFNDNVYYVGRMKTDNHLPGMFLPRRTMKYSDEDVPHKLYVIKKEKVLTIQQVDEFEVLVAKPAACKLILKGAPVPPSYTALDIKEENFEEKWDLIKAAIKAELKKGTIQVAMRGDIA